jgi:hypothetical protein
MSENSQTTIHVSIKIVKNLGDFNSLHIEAGTTSPKREDETFDEAFDRIYDKVEEKIEEKIAQAVTALKKVV